MFFKISTRFYPFILIKSHTTLEKNETNDGQVRKQKYGKNVFENDFSSNSFHTGLGLNAINRTKV